MKRLAKELLEGKLEHNCYLFFGEERYLIDLYEGKMRKYLEAGGDASMNMDTFWGKADVADIFDAVETMPFLSEYRLVIVKGSGLFASGRKNDSAYTAQRLLDISQTGIIVFVEENVDKRSAVYKAVTRVGRAIEFVRPPESELAAWIMREFKINEIIIDKASAVYLSRIASSGMEQIHQEIKKLSAYCADKKTVTMQDVDDICTKSLELKVFGLVDALAGKNADKALEIFENLMEVKESPIRVLSLIARQFRLILQCSQMRNKAPRDIAAAIGVQPFVVQECIKQGANFERETLIQAMKDCLEADIKIKTGQLADTLALESIIVKYAAKG